MPRRRPGALRDRHDGPRWWASPPPDRIHGLSARTNLAIHRLEGSQEAYLFPGATRYALQHYADFLKASRRRPLYPRPSDCNCQGHSFEDVRHSRDILAKVLEILPPGPRAELGNRVRVLDAEFLRRTLPDPFADRRSWRTELWWYRRIERSDRG